MPVSAMVQQSNANLGTGSTIKLVQENPKIVEMLGIRGKLAEAARALLDVDPAGFDYLNAIPGPVQESIRAAIFDAISGKRGQEPKPVQMSYVPAYEFGASVTDYGEAVSIEVRGPYEAASPSGKNARAKRSAGRTAARRGKPARRKVNPAKRKPARQPGR